MPKPTAVDRFLEAVPNWRFHRSGAEAIRETGEVVEYDLAWTEMEAADA